jgi:LTXXQ motif family protein
MEKPVMRTLARRAAPLLFTTILAAGPAWAQTTTGQPDTAPTATAPSGTGQKASPHNNLAAAERPRGETMQALVDQRIAELHSQLHITSQQSRQWDQFAQAMRDNAKEMDALYRQRAEKLGSMSAVQNMQSYAEIEEQRAQQTQKLVPAFQTLYDSMSDQQKSDADRVFQFRSSRAEARHHQAVKQ